MVNSNGGDKNVALQIVGLDNVPELSNTGVAASLGSGTQTAAYRLDVVNGQRLQIDTGSTTAADIGWVLFDENKSIAAQGTSAGTFSTVSLSGGRYTLLLKGRNPSALGVDYTLNVTPVTLPVLQVGEQIRGVVNEGQQPTQTYRLTIPVSGYYQVHNTDSDSRIGWAINAVGSSYLDWVSVASPSNGGSDAEAQNPHTRYLSAGDYEFSVRSNDLSRHFGLQIVSLSDAVLLPTTGSVGENFLPNQDVAVYRLDTTARRAVLNVHVQSSDASVVMTWVAYNRNMQVIGQGQGQADAVQVQDNGTGGPYTLQVKRQGSLAQGQYFTVGMTPVAPTGYSGRS